MENYKTKLENLIVNSGILKIIFTGICVFTIIIMFIIKFRQIASVESIPEIKNKKHVLQNQITIEEITKNAKEIKSGLFIENFTEFKIAEEHFIADLVIWFEYPQNSIPIDLLAKFDIEDSDIQKKTDPILESDGENTIVKFKVRADLNMLMEYQNFPFNDHRITIIINNKQINVRNHIFKTTKDFFMVAENFRLPDWKIMGRKYMFAKSGFFVEKLEEQEDETISMLYPVSLFTFTITKTSWFAILMTLLPLFTLFYLLVMTLLASIESFFRITGPVGFFSTILLSYRFNASDIAPNIGYSTISDKLHMFIAIICGIILIYQISCHRIYSVKTSPKNLTRKEQIQKMVLKLDSISFMASQLALIFYMFYLFFI